MSDAHDILEDAIRAHNAADDDGSVVTGWVLITASTVPGEPYSTATTYVVSDGMPAYALLGLLDIASHYAHARLEPPTEDE